MSLKQQQKSQKKYRQKQKGKEKLYFSIQVEIARWQEWIKPILKASHAAV